MPNARTTQPPPIAVFVMEPFSYVASSRAWRDLESFFNPNAAFGRVHIVSVTDDHQYESLEYGSLTVHPVPSRLPGGPLKFVRNLVAMAEAVRLMESAVAIEKQLGLPQLKNDLDMLEQLRAELSARH